MDVEYSVMNVPTDENQMSTETIPNPNLENQPENLQFKSEIEEERAILQDNIRRFLTANNVYNMMPSNSEVIAVDELASLYDLVYIFSSNDAHSILIWSTDKKIIHGVFVTSDLSNFLIGFNDELVQNFIDQAPLSVKVSNLANSDFVSMESENLPNSTGGGTINEDSLLSEETTSKSKKKEMQVRYKNLLKQITIKDLIVHYKNYKNLVSQN